MLALAVLFLKCSNEHKMREQFSDSYISASYDTRQCSLGLLSISLEKGGLAIVVSIRSESVPFRFSPGEPSPTVVSRPSQGHGGVRVPPCQIEEEGLGSVPRLLAGFWVSGPGRRGAAVCRAYGGEDFDSLRNRYSASVNGVTVQICLFLY